MSTAEIILDFSETRLPRKWGLTKLQRLKSGAGRDDGTWVVVENVNSKLDLSVHIACRFSPDIDLLRSIINTSFSEEGLFVPHITKNMLLTAVSKMPTIFDSHAIIEELQRSNPQSYTRDLVSVCEPPRSFRRPPQPNWKTAFLYRSQRVLTTLGSEPHRHQL